MKSIFVILMIVVVSMTVSASMMIPANDNAKEHSQAPDHSAVIGANWDLERVDFIHYAKPSNPTKPGGSSTCYKLMGVKWNAFPVSYAINPTNSGLNPSEVTSAISTAAGTWDDVTSKNLFAAYTTDLSAVYGTYDHKNAIDFGAGLGYNVIAVTSVWFDRRTKQIVEFDMRFSTAFNWGDANVNNALMDLQNIATHELGHAVGLNDLYTQSCTQVTMYGYSTEGETSKRSLETPDITGLRAMYGI